MDIKTTLKRLTEVSGVSGSEKQASLTALELLKQYVPDSELDNFGNVTGILKSGKDNAKLLMLDAHIDQIGMIVTYITDDGFLKVGACGGLDMRVLAAQSVTVHGKNPVLGVVSTLPPHVNSDHTHVPEIGEISIDIGMNYEQACEVVSLGDRVTINSDFRELCGDRISSPSTDDRSGVCAILAALDMMKDRELVYDIAVCFSAQEETGERGVKTAAFRLAPEEALVVDVSFGRTPDSAAHETAKLGSGVMIGKSAVLDSSMSEKLICIAKDKGIPYTIEVMPSSTGTNADAISVSRAGVKCCTLSIPLRYMHTPVETVSICDIENTAKLICEYCTVSNGGVSNA
ncbi:MAG: M42 family metallopeptidase [Oscillospiraceae bacterium]